MNLRRLVLLAGAVVLVVGVIGLLMPVSIIGPDNQSIGCGNAIAADDSAAREADNSNPVNLPILNEIIPHTDYVAQCASAVSAAAHVVHSGGDHRPGGDRRWIRRRRPGRQSAGRLAGFAIGDQVQTSGRLRGRDLVVDGGDHRVDPVHRAVA